MCPPPSGSGGWGTHSLAGEEEWGSNSDEGTDTLVLRYRYFVEESIEIFSLLPTSREQIEHFPHYITLLLVFVFRFYTGSTHTV